MKTIKQIMTELTELEIITKNYLQSLGYKTELASKKFKVFLTICNSLSIVLIHFNNLSYALKILQKALKIDVQMFFEGDFQDRCWNGRILIYCNLSFLLLKCKDYRSSLKFLYDSESLLNEIRLMGREINDIRLIHSIISFLGLISINKLANSEKYLILSINSFGLASERFDLICCKNIFCLLELARIILEEFNAGYQISAEVALLRVKNQADDNLGKALTEKFQGL